MAIDYTQNPTLPQTTPPPITPTTSSATIGNAPDLTHYTAGQTVDLGGGGKYIKNANGTFTPVPIASSQTTSGATSTQTTPSVTPPSQNTQSSQSGRTITDNLGNTYQVDANGQIYSGPSNGQYKVGSNISGNQSAQDQITSQLTGKTLDQIRLERENDAYNTEAQRVHDQIIGYQNGTIPLTAGQQAQVDALRAAFQQLIEEQRITNIGAQGTGNVRGYQTGAAEYDPNFQVKTIGAIVQAGQNKIADLNMKMASAIASLTESFRTNNIEAVKSAWTEYSGAAKARQEQLNKNIENAQKAIKDAQDAKIEADKIYYERFEKPIQDIALNAAKNGLKDAKILAAIKNSSSVEEAIANAGGYLQTATGDLGEYLQYQRDVQNRGLTPKDYTSWLDEKTAKASKAKASEAYATEYAKAAGKAAGEAKYGTQSGTATGTEALYTGLSNPTATAVRAKVAKFATEPLVQNYATIQDGYNFASSLANKTTNPADDQALIYSLAKALDPGSVVREGEYQTAQKYAQSWVQAYGKGVTQALAGTGFLSEDARKNIKTTIESKYKSSKKSYDNLQNQYIQGINNLTGRSDGSKFLVDYTTTINPKDEVNNYIKNNPSKAQIISNLYRVPGATDEDVLEYIQKLK